MQGRFLRKWGLAAELYYHHILHFSLPNAEGREEGLSWISYKFCRRTPEWEKVCLVSSKVKVEFSKALLAYRCCQLILYKDFFKFLFNKSVVNEQISFNG